MRNVEYKCLLRDRALAERLAKELGARHVATLEQRDTYYGHGAGRLKRREVTGQLTEWIEYRRPDVPEARTSDYTLLSPREAAERFDLDALRPWAVVEKRRDFWLVGDVRIHLDRVATLGEFLELEALVNERQDQAHAERALEALRAALKPALGPPCAESYGDMMAGKTATGLP